MKLAIHYAKGLFSERWVAYCTQNNIPYKIVNCYANNIVADLHDCTALLWHHHQGNPKDILFAKQLLFALEHAGFKVFPDFKTNWHFDDKVGQKYLLEALGVKQFVQSWVFYSKNEALEWVDTSSFPKVFKLRGGAGSQNVQLVHSASHARKLISKAFGKGFQTYNAWGSLKERIRKYRMGRSNVTTVMKGIVRLVIPPPYAQISGREKGYVYFQEFIPGNDSDTRIIIIDGKAFALKRFVRQNDFRASGSGNFKYDRSEFDERCVQISFEVTRKSGAQCVAFDFVFDKANQPRIIEISYGFAPEGYDDCPGYWDENLNWHEGRFNPYGWMVDSVTKSAAVPT
jgi:glutathione synthase/RimK-type ligase-like ATP-grasp enzyme